MKKIKILCKNNGITKEFPLGTTLIDIARDIVPEMNVIGVLVNNTLKNMDFEVFKPKTLKFLDASSTIGMDIYERTLSFILYVAARQLYPKEKLKVEHGVHNGIYCRFANKQLVLDNGKVAAIKLRMQAIIDQDLPIIREEIQTEKAIDLFAKQGLLDKVSILKTRGNLYNSVYSLAGEVNYYYNALAPSTGSVKVFNLVHHYKGMLLFLPKTSNPKETSEFIEQPQKFAVVNEFKRWGKILGVTDVGTLNDTVINRSISDFIKISEALHEKKIARIADEIYHLRKKTKLILIAGPSSSGKTTFSKRLSIQLRANGLRPVNISTDNYFVDREFNPKDENGEYDFETIEAVDLKQFNQDLTDLIAQKEIQVPRFSFQEGKRQYTGETLSISKKNVIIIEGIHALNPRLTEAIDDKLKYKIYISALASINIDRDNRIPSFENRLIRRIIRDYNYRGYSAKDTISRWESVRRGEKKHVIPYMNEANIMFNSALPYELGVLKQYAEPILREVSSNCKEYSEAQRLLKFFSFFVPILADEIPPTSLLREFLGGSSFEY
ncbi:uridine kinase [Balneicella halophila]|uniref:Uridine kinase n=1 Tax=Balneicella halophila TaxID=1537566 RepID=A0A7L4UMJ5_BALHA|nr:nucleoside kinase [Balneicella halophila]PVX49841.1 uridine kinase [Balneicella halophila]